MDISHSASQTLSPLWEPLSPLPPQPAKPISPSGSPSQEMAPQPARGSPRPAQRLLPFLPCSHLSARLRSVFDVYVMSNVPSLFAIMLDKPFHRSFDLNSVDNPLWRAVLNRVSLVSQVLLSYSKRIYIQCTLVILSLSWKYCMT